MGMMDCSVCGEEVRWGTRGGRTAWWHRDDQPDESTGYVDKRIGHEPILGTPASATDWAAVEAMRERYAEANEADDRVFEIPPPEIYTREIEISDDLLPGGASNLIKACHKAGGRTLATYSRAARVHGSHGNLLGMSDYVMVKFEVEDRRSVAVWVDMKLDTAYLLHYRDDTIFPERTSSAGIRAHFKEAPDA